VVVVIAILVFGIRAYESSQNTQALKNYDLEVTNLMSGQETELSQPLFSSLESAPGTAAGAIGTLQATIYQDYVTAQQNAQTAAGWNVPSAVAGAQADLLLVLDLRAEAIDKISGQIESALNNGSLSAVRDIAGAMQMIAASDTLYAVRVQPLIEQALVNDGIQVAGTGAAGGTLGGEVVPSSQFLPNQSWTVAGYVAGKILGSTPTQLGGTLGAGAHGHKIISVMVNGTVLTPGDSTINPITYGSNIQYVVAFVNDGQNDEFDVVTQLALQSATTGTQTTQASTRETMPGQQVQATLAFPNPPPKNTTLQLTATIERVNGETDVGNNTLTYLVQFTNS
jgi:hypothetical protein